MASMFLSGLLLLSLGSTTALAQAAAPAPPPAETPPRGQEPEAFVALLRDPSGAPVARAQGFLIGQAVGGLPALGDLGDTIGDTIGDGPSDLAGVLPRRPRATGISDARGTLRLLPDGGRPFRGAGFGFVATESGLGALLVDLQPGKAQRVELQPMAAIGTATGSEHLTVFARARIGPDTLVTLPPQRGTAVRLPAGDHELWIATADGWIWARQRLASGQRSDLGFEDAPRRLRRDSTDLRVHPAGRPDVPLFAAGALETVLRGVAAGATFTGYDVRSGATFGPSALPPPGAAGVVAWPATNRSSPAVALRPAPRPNGREVPPAEALFSLQRREDGSWRVLGAGAVRNSGPDSDPCFFLPPPLAGDNWLLFIAKDHAPQARPWPGDERFPFAYQTGVALTANARDAQGLPVAGLCVEYVPDGMDPALVAGATDARGIVRLGPVLAPGTLRVSDPRFRNQEIELPTIPAAGATIAVSLGGELRGVAKWTDGATAPGVVVALRDATGHLRPAQRTVVSGNDGSFLFPGLPDRLPFVLFASAQRDGRTWSGRLSAALAGAGPCELVLHDEDPQLIPGAGR